MFTIAKSAKMLSNGSITSVELTNKCIENIRKKDINAFITLTLETALESAKAADKLRATGSKVSPLCGIPFAIKDNICVKGIKTTAASAILKDFIAPYDAFVYEKLKKAGAVLIGKANMDEFAMGSSSETSYYGVVKNPINTDYSPGGSSGGSAAAVAAGQALFALGSDTGGSIRQPACFCGVVGLKPTYGSVSRRGLIAFSSSFDQIGICALSAKDALMVFNEIRGKDPLDMTSVDAPNICTKGKKIGALESDVPEYISACNRLIGAGYEIEYIDFPFVNEALSAYHIISSVEAASNLARYDWKYAAIKDTRTYNEIRTEAIGKEVKRRIMTGNYLITSPKYKELYLKACSLKEKIKYEYSKLFEKYSFLISPTSSEPAFKTGSILDPTEMHKQDIFTIPVNLAGLTAVSVPCGTRNGLPMGLQIIGRPFDENGILNLADVFERKLNEI